MKERPIIFSDPMVPLILRVIKTMTRRTRGLEMVNINPEARIGAVNSHDDVWDFVMHDGGSQRGIKCPYGKPGDQLWVRESFWAYGKWEQRYSEKKQWMEWCFVDMTVERDRLYQYADPTPEKFRHRRDIDPAWWPRNSIHMPRKASRIQLEITAIRVERLQDISEADAIAEGIEHGNRWLNNYRNYFNDNDAHGWRSPIDSYRSLWETINGEGSWDANHWVWVVEFKVLKP
jgi:hypothetical protein